MFGTCVHLFYILMLFLYTYDKYVYIDNPMIEASNSQSIMILVCVTYPAIYESMQAVKGGIWEYFTDISNYLDIMFVWGSIAMSIVHFISGA